MKKLFVFLSCLIALNVNLIAENGEKAVLQAEVELLPATPTDKHAPVIQPGSQILVSTQIKNTGTKANEKGYFFVRFVYPTPLAGKANNELFQTEKVMLPSIQPGKVASITFKTPQQSPSVFDFIREDFGMRQYQAVIVIDNKEYIIGNAALTFSAYYYSTPAHEIPLEVPGI
jgi:hypothetical protein